MKNAFAIIGIVLMLVACGGKKEPQPEVIVDNNNAVKDSVWLNEKFFPDENFRTELCKIMPLAEGQVIPNEYLPEMKTLLLSKKGIRSLKGIEYFPNLEVLACNDNELTEIDVSKNANLHTLECGSNQIRFIDVTHNTKLTGFGCSYNELTNIDVVKNPELRYLICNGNQLVSINVAHNPMLNKLGVNDNKLTELDVTKNPDLRCLYCDGNGLKELNLRNNNQLEELFCKEDRGLFKRPIKIIPPLNNPDLENVSRNMWSDQVGIFYFPNHFD